MAPYRVEPLTVLVTGATGLIGGRLARALADQGHRVVAASRSPRLQGSMTPLAVDFADAPPPGWWAERLAGVDVVINAVGIFRESGGQTFDALHVRAPIALFEGAAQAGVRCVVQLSALGSDGGTTAYHRSKHEADETLRRLPVDSVIVQPSLVYAPDGTSAQLFRQLAALPVLVLPATNAQVQPVHLDDLLQALQHLLLTPGSGTTTLAAVGPEPMTLAHYLARLRSAMGLARPAWLWRVPPGLALLAARLLGSLPGSLVDASAVRMLLQGQQADPSAFAAVLGRAPRPVEAFIAPQEAGAALQSAWLRTAALLATASVAFVWIWTGLVSMGLYPVAGSLALLADFGLHGRAAWAALYAGALLDLAMGGLTLLAPARWMRAVWGTQLLVIAGYTALITLRMPEWWLHPYGPLSKNLPMMAAIAMLWVLQRRA
jgi:uncharacterized protein YbjT (DUF2867 family)